VTSGAYAIFDANNTTSLPSSGTIWKDISGNGRDMSFFSWGPVEVSTSGGRTALIGKTSIQGGGRAYVFPGGATANYTVQTWVKIYGYNRRDRILGSGNIDLFKFNTQIGGNRNIQSFGNTVVSGARAGEWYNIAVTVSGTSVKTYLNGSPGPTSSNGVAISDSELGIGYDRYLAGYFGFGDILAYNRALSPAEILQNYQNKSSIYTNTSPVPGTPTYIYSNVDLPCDNGPSGENLYSSTPAGMGTVFYLDSQMTFTAGGAYRVGSADYGMNGDGTVVNDQLTCD